MADNSRGLIFRKRNVLGAALVAGIGLGLYLGNYFGFGNGGSGFFGFGNPNHGTSVNSDADGDSNKSAEIPANTEIVGGDSPKNDTQFVQVVIDEHEYLLKNEAKETPIPLNDLVELVKKAPGDNHGVRLRVIEKGSARMKAEEDLKAAMKQAEIPETAVIWVPPAIAK